MSIRIVVAACVGSCVLGAAGISLRAQAQELISACVKPSGQIRIVDATQVCSAGERRLDWPATAPALGPLRVVDANGTFIGRYADQGTTILSVGTEWISAALTVDGPRKFDTGPVFYFSTDCPNPADKTVLHGTPGHLGFANRELVKFALALPAAPNVVYYPGSEDPAFVRSRSSSTSPRRMALNGCASRSRSRSASSRGTHRRSRSILACTARRIASCPNGGR